MSQPRILIVHPEESSLALLSSMLRSLGHVIDEAANDRLAVKLLERGGIDMILAGVDPSDPEALGDHAMLAQLVGEHRCRPRGQPLRPSLPLVAQGSRCSLRCAFVRPSAEIRAASASIDGLGVSASA